MERYILFAGDLYYPSGGVGDMQGAYATLEEAVHASGGKDGYDWWHVFDVKERKVVADGWGGWVFEKNEAARRILERQNPVPIDNSLKAVVGTFEWSKK